jgi:rifampicin phosphotransferase
MSVVIDDSARVINENLPVGGKARSLAVAQNNGLPVPRWCVILSEAFDGTYMLNCPVEAALQEILATRFQGVKFFAVRSSAMEEDGQHASFAGLFESHLYVAPHQIAAKIADIWRESRSPRITAYCGEKGLPLPETVPAVIVQEMVAAEKSGVAFSADPITGCRNLAVISATWGLGSGLVSGECESDAYAVTSHLEVVRHQIVTKTRCHQMMPDTTDTASVITSTVPEAQQSQSVLIHGEIVSVANLAFQAARIFGSPQDIEWSIANGRLYLLQSRPITTLPPEPSDIPERWHTWDNSTIVESWPGVNTPLTCDLAKRLQAQTYRDTSRLTCLPKKPEAEYQALFTKVTGCLHGQIYLDQRVLDDLWFLAPSIPYRLQDCLLETQKLFHHIPRLRANHMLLSALVSLLKRWSHGIAGLSRLLNLYRGLGKKIQLLDKQVGQHLNTPIQADTEWSQVEALLNLLENHWQAPTLTNYFANRLMEMLIRLDPSGQSLFDSGKNTGPLLSEQFLNQIKAMAYLAKEHPGLPEALQTASIDTLYETIAGIPTFKAVLNQFLNQFGDRCNADLKLESLTWSDNPLPMLRTVGMAAFAPSTHKPKISSKVRYGLWQRFLLSHYQRCVVRREHCRLHLTRLVAALRRSILSLGDSLHQQGDLSIPRDILYLTFPEIQAMVTTSSSDNKENSLILERIESRKIAYQQDLQRPPLPDRFEAWGPLTPEPQEAEDTPGGLSQQAAKGQPCSPGQVTGEVIWFSENREITAYQGKILAAPYGDPSLITVYPMIQGLLLERGSVLSHPAIVARELGVPTIVGLTGLSAWLQDHETVTMDGGTGHITRNPTV